MAFTKLLHRLYRRISGKGTSSLESALSAFQQAIIQSEADNASAASPLAAPAGFDASGQVVDRNAALKTLRNAGQSLRQALQAYLGK